MALVLCWKENGFNCN